MPRQAKILTEDDVLKEIQLFRQQQKTLMLASLSENKQPLASYAPFIEDNEGRFFSFTQWSGCS